MSYSIVNMQNSLLDSHPIPLHSIKKKNTKIKQIIAGNLYLPIQLLRIFLANILYTIYD